ncbi:CHAT domain-containing protein [Saprospira grandis]|uniref:CHAT domain-containing protein n=1 Tax=Saprospira grandis TaxID=1008 RepID=UPI0022DE0C5F|nr:CHAT domain-containing protein [Saprospira grandis]WBM75828.1 CHAT domain-containing protein [Saprospira grandis]
MRPIHYIYLFLLAPVLVFGQDAAKYNAFEARFMEAYAQSQYAHSIAIIDSALLALETEPGRQGWKDSLSWSFTGSKMVLQYNLGQYEAVQATLMAAKSQVERLDQGKKGLHLAEWLGLRAKLYLAENNFEQATAKQLEAKAIFEQLKLEATPQYITLINNIAVVYLKQAKYDLAADFFRQSIALERKHNDAKGEPYARSLYNVMAIEEKAGQYTKAEQTANLILKIMEEVGRENEFYLKIMIAKGGVLERKEAFAKAKEVYLTALALAKSKQYDQLIPSITFNLGKACMAEQDYLAAETYYKAALGQTKGMMRQTVLSSLLKLYIVQEDYQQAENYLEQYRAEVAAVFAPKTVKYIQSLKYVARLEIAKGDFDAAEAAILQHLELNSTQEKRFDLDQLAGLDINYFLDLGELSKILFIAKDLEGKRYQESKAPASLKRLLTIDSLYAETLAKEREMAQLEQDRLRSLKVSSATYQRLMKWAHLDQQAAEQLLAISEKDKSTLLLESQNERIAYSKKLLPKNEQEKEQGIKKQYRQILKAYRSTEEKAKKDSLLVLLNDQIWEMEEHKRHLFKQYPDYVDYKFGHKRLQLKQLQKDLGPKRAAIEYFLTDSSCFVFYLDHQELRYVEQKINAKELAQELMDLQRMLLSYKQVLSGNEEVFLNYSQKAHQLYQLLLAPVLQNPKSTVKQLLIIPDKELAYIPFESLLMLPAKETDNYNSLAYLIKRYAISYSFSLELWQHNQNTSFQENNGQMLAMAANYQEGDTISLNNKRSQLTPLKLAEEEVKKLATLFEGRFLFGQDAQEERFIKESKKYRFIHLAMHGLMNREKPSLSGLAFTPDSDSLEDGFLQAIEILNLDLKADLVVLSACETAYGEFQVGNGTASLATAFINAGVPALLVSLWQVDDAATSVIMQDFYQQLEAGLSKSEALRQAKLNYLAANKGPMAHPAFWSPFILMGNDKKLNLPPSNPFLPFAIGGIMLSAGGAFLLRQKRKNRSKEKAA